MANASGWFMCRVGFVETVRAVTLAAGTRAARAVREEWSAFGILEVDQDLAEAAAGLAVRHRLRSLDALHLAAALVLPRRELVFATWDERLAAAARRERLDVSPA